MNFYTRKATFVFSTVFSLAFSTFANIDKNSNGDFVLNSCGFNGGEKYQIFVNNSQSQLGGTVSPDGCIKTTFRNANSVSPGNNIKIVTASKTTSETVPGSSSNNGNTGNGNQDTVQAPSIPSVDLDKVSKTAENNARCMANAVVEAYGEAERLRYSVQTGLRDGVFVYRYEDRNSYSSSVDYSSGYSAGSSNGGQSGFDAGKRKGQDDGISQGSAQANNRFLVVVDTDAAPDLTPSVPAVNFSGLSPNLQQPRSLEDRLRDKDAQIQSWVRNLRLGYDGYYLSYDSIWRNEWSAAYFYSHSKYEFETVKSWYRDDWAFDLWQRRAFKRCSDQVDYFNKISDSSKTGNSSAAKSEFIRTFKVVYDNVIDEKWLRKVTSIDQQAYSFGKDVGFQTAQSYVQDLGYMAGYSNSFTQASVQGYNSNDNFNTSFQAAFNNEANKLNSNSKLIIEGAVLINQDGTTNLGVGSSLKVLVKKITNYGRQNAEVSVKLNGSVNSKQTSFEVPYSKSISSQEFSNMGSVPASVAPESNFTATLVIGDISLSVSANTQFSSTIKNYIQADSSLKNQLISYISGHLDQEMMAIFKGGGFFGGKNAYKDSPQQTLLKKFVDTYNQLSPQEKSILKPCVDDIAAKFKSRKPGFFDFDNKSKHEAAMKIFNTLVK